MKGDNVNLGTLQKCLNARVVSMVSLNRLVYIFTAGVATSLQFAVILARLELFVSKFSIYVSLVNSVSVAENPAL